jgi:hypothetical protein
MLFAPDPSPDLQSKKRKTSLSFIARPLSREYATLNATHSQHSAFLASGVASRHGIEAPSRAPPMTLGNMRVRFVHWFAAVCVATVVVL